MSGAVAAVGTVLGRIAAEIAPAVLSQRGDKRLARISWLAWDLVLRARGMTHIPGEARGVWVVSELYAQAERGGWWRRRKWRWIRKESVTAVSDLVEQVYREQEELAGISMADIAALPPCPPGSEDCIIEM